MDPTEIPDCSHLFNLLNFYFFARLDPLLLFPLPLGCLLGCFSIPPCSLILPTPISPPPPWLTLWPCKSIIIAPMCSARAHRGAHPLHVTAGQLLARLLFCGLAADGYRWWVGWWVVGARWTGCF